MPDYFQTFEARFPQIASHSSQNAAGQFAIEEFKRFMSIGGTIRSNFPNVATDVDEG